MCSGVTSSHLIEFHGESPVFAFSVDGLNRGGVTVYLLGVTDGVPGVIEAGGVEDFRVVTLNPVWDVFFLGRGTIEEPY